MITKFSHAKILAVWTIIQSLSLSAMALDVGTHKTKPSFSAPVNAKLGSATNPPGDEATIAPATKEEVERERLRAIYDAAINRSQDIQFVVRKFVQTKKPRHSPAVMTKMLSTAMATAATSAPVGQIDIDSIDFADDRFAKGTDHMMLSRSAGASFVRSILDPNVCGSAQRKAPVTETEAIMLYTMIRGVLDKTAEAYHKYVASLQRGVNYRSEFESLAKNGNDARDSQNATTQMHQEYKRRKILREIEAMNDEASSARQQLVEIAGAEAVDDLDTQLDAKELKLDQLEIQKGSAINE